MTDKRDDSNNRLDQYKQIRQDIRDYNRSVWQTPSAALAIESALVTVVFGTSLVLTPCGKAVLVLVGTLLVIGLLLTFVKHAHFQKLKANAAVDLGRELGMADEHFPAVDWGDDLRETESQLRPGGVRGFLSSLSAVIWLARFLYVVVAGNAYLIAVFGKDCLG